MSHKLRAEPSGPQSAQGQTSKGLCRTQVSACIRSEMWVCVWAWEIEKFSYAPDIRLLFQKLVGLRLRHLCHPSPALAGAFSCAAVCPVRPLASAPVFAVRLEVRCRFGGVRSGGREIHRQPGRRAQLQHRDSVKLVAERLLAGLVAEQMPPGIGPRRPPKQRPAEQGRLADPPCAVLGQCLVDPERREGDEIDHDGVVGRDLGGKHGHGLGLHCVDQKMFCADFNQYAPPLEGGSLLVR